MSVVDKSFVWQMKTDATAKLIAVYLLDQDARVFSREELAVALGVGMYELGTAIQAGMVRNPPLFARADDDGHRLTPSHAYIPADSPLRTAWNAGSRKPKKREKHDPESQAP